MDIAIVLYDGFDELDAIGPYEVFQTAAAAGGDCRATLRTMEASPGVTASHGLRVVPDSPFEDVRPDVVVVPGGGWTDRGPAGAWAEAERGTIPAAVARHHEAGAITAGVCTGGMLLARAGVLDGRPAVTHKSALDDLRKTKAEVVDARVVDDGDVLTAGGVTSGLDLAMHLVEREFGATVAGRVRTEMEYEPRGTVYRG